MSAADFVATEQARMLRMADKLTAQFARQDAARNPAFAEDWDHRHPVRFTKATRTALGVKYEDAA